MAAAGVISQSITNVLAFEDNFPRPGLLGAWTDPRRPPAGLLRMSAPSEEDGRAAANAGDIVKCGPGRTRPRRRLPPLRAKRSTPSPERASQGPRRREREMISSNVSVYNLPASGLSGADYRIFRRINNPHDPSDHRPPTPPAHPSAVPSSSRTWRAPPSAAA